jgi:hypothetical protein
MSLIRPRGEYADAANGGTGSRPAPADRHDRDLTPAP